MPSIRYCAYNIGDMPSDLSQLIKLRASAPGSDILASKIDVSGKCCVIEVLKWDC